MKNKPTFITFTGIDARTDLGKVQALSKKYPIEWGVLFGGSLSTPQRYPEPEVVRAALALEDVQFAAHLCGFYAKRAMGQGIVASELNMILGSNRFARFQVNAGKYDMPSLLRLRDMLGKPIIFQARGKEFPPPLEPLPPLADPLVFCRIPAVYSLHDLSGGKGKAPPFRPVQRPGIPIVGYAGGIGPDNVVQVISEIDASLYWLDMETNVRTDDWLDLDKCEAVCKQVWE